MMEPAGLGVPTGLIPEATDGASAAESGLADPIVQVRLPIARAPVLAHEAPPSRPEKND